MKEYRQDKFTCAICRNTYDKSWTDDEAETEMKEIWGVIPKEDRVIICDDCFNLRSKQDIVKMGEAYQSNK